MCRNSKLQFPIAITKWFVYFSPLPLPLFFCMLGNESYLKKILWDSINEQWVCRWKRRKMIHLPWKDEEIPRSTKQTKKSKKWPKKIIFPTVSSLLLFARPSRSSALSCGWTSRIQMYRGCGRRGFLAPPKYIWL